MVEATVPTLLHDKYITYAERKDPDHPDRSYPASANDFVNEKHAQTYAASIADPAAFWDVEAKRLWWHKPYTTIVDTSDQYLHKWFPDGETNICYNAVDRHVANGDGGLVAFIEDSAYTGVKRKWTYAQVQEQVGRLATVLKGLGVA